MKRIGIFAGIFDPIHDGHIEVARQCVDLLELDHMYLMTEEKSWGAKAPVDVKHRIAMVDIAVGDSERVQQLSVGDTQFTIDETLPKLEQRFNDCELYFVLGADVFMAMDSQQWPGLDKLLQHYLVVFERSGVDAETIQDKAKTLGVAVAIFPSPHPEHSSTDVRMNPHNKEIWVPERIAKYIDENELYSPADSSVV